MYRLSIRPAEERSDAIVRLRKEICKAIGMDADGPDALPLDYATYLFVERNDVPVGMVELFFYDQCSKAHTDEMYARSARLAQLAPANELAHVGSVIVDAPFRGTRAFLCLVAAMILAAHRMGARYLTAATGVDNHEIIALHRTAGMAPLGRFEHDGSLFAQSLLDVGSRAARAAAILERCGVTLDSAALQTLRGRTGEPLEQVMANAC
jgi:RimJ/RimL family protein N-acetyltransferase